MLVEKRVDKNSHYMPRGFINLNLLLYFESTILTGNLEISKMI
jgi:hypothetical protein